MSETAAAAVSDIPIGMPMPMEFRLPQNTIQPNIIQVDIDNGRTLFDLVVDIAAIWAFGSVITFGLVWIRQDYSVEKTINKWWEWLMWPLALPITHIAYAYLKSSLKSAVTSGLPKEASKTKKWTLNALMPGAGDAYAGLIRELNHLKDTGGGSIRAAVLPGLALLGADCGNH